MARAGADRAASAASSSAPNAVVGAMRTLGLRPERLGDQRLQAERRLRRRRVRIRKDVDLRGGAALQAREALEIRLARAAARSAARASAARALQASASTTRGTITTSAIVIASRWIHGAAGAPALRSPGRVCSAAKPASSGNAMPDSALAGASAVESSVCTVGADRNVLSQPTR